VKILHQSCVWTRDLEHEWYFRVRPGENTFFTSILVCRDLVNG